MPRSLPESKAMTKCPLCGHPLMRDLQSVWIEGIPRNLEVWCANCHYARPAKASRKP
jgi:hypothetical protein